MNNHGFIRVASAIPTLKVADCFYNTTEIENLIQESYKKGVSIVVFPELSVSGYTCSDLFLKPLLLEKSEEALAKLLHNTSSLDIVFIVGMPLAIGNFIANVAVVCHKGKIMGVIPKTYLPNYREFYEKRWFSSSKEIAQEQVLLCNQQVPFGIDLLFQIGKTKFGIEICEDLWAVVPPSSSACLQGADIIFNLSASPVLAGKYQYVRSLIAQQSARCLSGYVYASCGLGESTTDVAFASNGLIYESGTLLANSQTFSLDSQLVVSEIDVERIHTERLVNSTFKEQVGEILQDESYLFVPINHIAQDLNTLFRTVSAKPFDAQEDHCHDVFNTQVLGLISRLKHINCKKVVLGISGGLDSTLALLVCVETFKKMGISTESIIGVTMPGFGTTDRTYQNALTLMKKLGISIREISIKEACLQHFKDIGHDVSCKDITYENTQARERTQILMDVANKENAIVIGTGDLSELALGWATYNGDHMSMYNVNVDVPKTLVLSLVNWVAEKSQSDCVKEVLKDILATPISPELLPASSQGKILQKTESLVGPYELHDFFLFYFLRHGFGPKKIYFLATLAFKDIFPKEEIIKWLEVFVKRFFSQQFKRSCLPDGPKVGAVALSPRGDWKMPSDASARMWLDEIKEIKTVS